MLSQEPLGANRVKDEIALSQVVLLATAGDSSQRMSWYSIEPSSKTALDSQTRKVSRSPNRVVDESV
ncbi:hypothetical protein [Crateriforma conspicua]|uniref:hypothetical protein n=1 Tax=Crateriforma conspicua TaxID=2527996 RepID=UPI0011AA6524|nr:hypothetical protein [Crateriforma conspicua]